VIIASTADLPLILQNPVPALELDRLTRPLARFTLVKDIFKRWKNRLEKAEKARRKQERRDEKNARTQYALRRGFFNSYHIVSCIGEPRPEGYITVPIESLCARYADEWQHIKDFLTLVDEPQLLYRPAKETQMMSLYCRADQFSDAVFDRVQKEAHFVMKIALPEYLRKSQLPDIKKAVVYEVIIEGADDVAAAEARGLEPRVVERAVRDVWRDLEPVMLGAITSWAINDDERNPVRAEARTMVAPSS
jgi:hypothetical protein